MSMNSPVQRTAGRKSVLPCNTRLNGLIISVLLFLSFQSPGQNNRIRCYTVEHTDHLKQQDPKLEKRLQQSRSFISKWISEHPGPMRSSQGANTIPVVVHVVYNTPAENISDAQVFSQIDVLNEDFARLNADTVKTPAPFRSVASSVPYQFCMAQRDPSGSPTNGIERRQTMVSNFTDDDNVKHFVTGGLDSWNVTEYMNIWVCNLDGNIIGYGEYPTSFVSPTYGLVVQYDAFGRTGTLTAPYDHGRTSSHEIGHCFDLYHIWGDDGGDCSGDDACADTPNQGDLNYGCLTFPAYDNCTTTGNGIMFMNYMDYSDDTCLNLYTNDQAIRMTAAIINYYPGLLSSNACDPIVVQAVDAGTYTVLSPLGSSCDSSVAPVVEIKNWGSLNLTSALINYQIDGGTIYSYPWTGNLSSQGSITITLPVIYASDGTHTFTAFTTSPNSISDPNPVNDTMRTTFSITALHGLVLPESEGFEANFPPAGFSIQNDDGASTWNPINAFAHGGLGCTGMDNFNYNASGERDALILPAFDLTSIIQPALSFWLAYAHYFDTGVGTFTDSLEVSLSTDCGSSWTNLFLDGGATLNTTPSGNPLPDPFIPAAADWKKFIIDLSAYATQSSVLFRFTNITDYGNNMYLDDINIDVNTGLNEWISRPEILTYPNPSNDKLFINLKSCQANKIIIKVTNLLGQPLSSTVVLLPSDFVELPVNDLSNGMYFLELQTADWRIRKGFLIQGHE